MAPADESVCRFTLGQGMLLRCAGIHSGLPRRSRRHAVRAAEIVTARAAERCTTCASQIIFLAQIVSFLELDFIKVTSKSADPKFTRAMVALTPFATAFARRGGHEEAVNSTSAFDPMYTRTKAINMNVDFRR